MEQLPLWLQLIKTGGNGCCCAPISKEWGADRLAGQLQLRARQTRLGMMVPSQGLQREEKLGGFYQRAPGPARPRGVLLMLLAPSLRMPPHPSHALCLWLLHVVCVTAGFPLPSAPAPTRSTACPQPDSGGPLAPWACPPRFFLDGNLRAVS